MGDRFDARTVGAVAIGLAVLVAIAWFVRSVAPTLSLTVQSVLFVLGALVALVGAGTTRWSEELTFLAILLLAAGVAYAASTHPFGADGVVAATIGTIAVVLALVYLYQKRLIDFRPREATAVMLVVALAGGGLVGADLRADPVSYERTVADATGVPADPAAAEPLTVGTATATNPSPFREQVRFPPARACLYNGTARVDAPVLYGVGGEFYPTSVGSSRTLRTNMTVLASAATVDPMNRTVPVERADACPEQSRSQRIVVVLEE